MATYHFVTIRLPYRRLHLFAVTAPARRFPRRALPAKTSAPKALILVAAELEAEILFGTPRHRASWLDVCVAGVGTGGDGAARQAIDATAAELVVNPGFAGGLSAAARPGSCFTVTRWVGLERANLHREVPPGLVDKLAPLAIRPATAMTVDLPVGDPESRRELAATGADLVEMEGARWALAAFRRGLPFVSLRVISDCADDALARPRHELLTATGSVRWARWLRATAGSDHGWLEALTRLRGAQRDWRLACASLRTVGAAITAWQRDTS